VIAPDTNVLVRIITNDDTVQATLAADALRSETVFLCKTVIMELEWVLRYSYRLDRATVNRALTTLVGLENLVIEDAETVEKAIGQHAKGMDLADALHLSSSRNADTFVTFDRKMAGAASRYHRDTGLTVRLLGDSEDD
jgi:predicted nucleic-acid-binding protein